MIEQVSALRKNNPKLFEIIRFLFVGGLATIIDMAVMSIVIYLPNKETVSFMEVLTSNFKPESWLVILATAIGFIVGLVFNYAFSIFYVYEGENKYAKTKKGFLLFLVLSAIGLAIQTLGMFLGYTLLGINEWVVKIILVLVVLAFNYISRKIFIFNKDKQNELIANNIYKKESLSKKSIIFNICFIVSSMALSKLLYQDVSNASIYGYLCAILSGAIVAFFMFFITKNLYLKLEIKSKPIFIVSIIFSALAAFPFLFYHSSQLFFYDYVLMLVLSLFAIFVYCNLLTSFAFKRIKKFCNNLSKVEKKTFISLFVAGCFISIVVFFFTNAFQVADGVYYDAFVSFDTGYMSYLKSHVNIWGAENDARHLIIGLCTFPFAIIPFALSKLLFFVPYVYQLSLVFIQCLIGAYSIIKINQFLKIKDSTFKILFCLLFFVSAGTIFNVITLEKFMFALFYLVVFMTFEQENNPIKWLVLISLIGILTTNIFLLLLLILKEKQNLKNTIILIFDFTILFVCVLVVFGQLPILLNLPFSLSNISSFSTLKNNIGLLEIICQFFIFLSSIFIFPPYQLSGADVIQSAPGINVFFVLGILIFILSIISFIINFKNNFAKTCFYWQLIMVVLLLILGWGSSRNEMFIYSSIFLWPTLSLLWLLFDKIENKVLKISILSFLLTAIAVYNFYCLTNISSLLSIGYPSLI